MELGVNYPWFDSGWDFGLGPPEWRGTRTLPRWTDAIDVHLARIHGLGLRVVRWFVLGDGLTCGHHEQAPRPDPARPGQWRYHPQPAGDDVLAHFRELLDRFSTFNA